MPIAKCLQVSGKLSCGLVAHLQIRMESSPENVAEGQWPRVRQGQHAVIAADQVLELRTVLGLKVRMTRKHFIEHHACGPKIRAGVHLSGEEPLW